jgi:hypothetical protein
MPKLGLWLQMVGARQTKWFESSLRLEGSVWMIGQAQDKSVAAGDGLFMQQLAERVWKLFDTTRQACKAPADPLEVSSQAS